MTTAELRLECLKVAQASTGGMPLDAADLIRRAELLLDWVRTKVAPAPRRRR